MAVSLERAKQQRASTSIAYCLSVPVPVPGDRRDWRSVGLKGC